MGGDLAPGLYRLFARLHDRIAANDHRFRTAGTAASDQLIAVALYQANALERDAELGTEDLRERRGVALAVVEGPGDDCHVAVWLEADAAHLAAGWSAQFEVVADPPPA